MASERAFEMALRFTISVPGVTPQSSELLSPEHLLQNAKYAGMGPLSEDEFKAIRLRLATAFEWRVGGANVKRSPGRRISLMMGVAASCRPP